MHHFPYPSYLRTHRTRWALTQSELGALLGVSAKTVSAYESLAQAPNLKALIASEFIFGEPGRRIFPGLFAPVELAVTRRAAHFAEALAGKDAPDALVKRQLLEAIAARAANDAAHV